jgi:ribonucleoside-diphosphate reductase alpha chain
LKVKKRDGKLEDFSPEKLNEVVVWACKGLEANPSDIVMNANLQLYSGIKTSKIHEVLVNSSANLINIKNSDYQWSTSRLLSFFTRKQLFGVFKDEEMPSIEEVFAINAKLGFYDADIIKKWTKDELEAIEGIIDHSNDNLLTYASYKKMLDSYVVKNRVTGYTYETPQYSFIVIAMTLENTVEGVRNLYESLVNKSISFPTPIMAGVRTNSKQYASCVLIDSGDDLESIYASAHAIGRFVSRKAGIGLNFGRWRALGSSIRNGEVFHTGVIPFLKLMQASVKSCSQGGVRDGSATTNFPIWHPEISDLLVLKNNKGTDDNRVKNLDYCVQLTGFFLKRMLKNEKISLFSTNDAPELIDLWGLPEFDEVYLKYETDKKVKRTEIDGQELLLSIATERLNTGRLYISFIDNVNSTNQFKERITMTNLCTEISLVTLPITDVNSDEGEIALCNLGGLNLGSLKGKDTFHLMEKPLRDIVRALDTVIDIQEYPVKAAEKQLKRRSIGVGVTNFAYWMAKNGFKYADDEALPLIDELFEHFQFYLIKASMELAKERGACEWFEKTKYADGVMPFDNINDEAKKLVVRPLTLDWEWLRKEVVTHGMRNSVLSAQMPVESSSMVTNSTNGLEAPRELVTVKTNKSGASTVMVVPEGKKLANKYTLAWDITSNSCVNKITAVVQKWLDQAISVNHYYNPTLFEGNQIPAKVIIKDIVEFYKLGGKNLYYANTLDAIEVEIEDCESCKL